MSRAFILLWLIVIVLTSCGPFITAAPERASVSQPTIVPATLPERHTDNSCAVTEPIEAEPPHNPNEGPFGFGNTWYVNDDQTLWADAQEWRDWRVGGHKVFWIHPQGADLVITGRRLDGEAPPLHAEIPCCSDSSDPIRYQVTGLIFPTEGCWEVIGRAGNSQLRFVAKVASAGYLIPESACESLADVVKHSEMIVIGSITDTETEADYAWVTVEVLEIWKPLGGLAGGWISVLQDLRSEPALEKDGQYLLFMQPGGWKLLCAQRSSFEKQGEQAIPDGDNPLWLGGSMADLTTEIRRLLKAP